MPSYYQRLSISAGFVDAQRLFLGAIPPADGGENAEEAQILLQNSVSAEF
jgi:hypothetical protein